ncbi:hypothetical protein ACG92U_12355 [Leuconostoc citreum]
MPQQLGVPFSETQPVDLVLQAENNESVTKTDESKGDAAAKAKADAVKAAAAEKAKQEAAAKALAEAAAKAKAEQEAALKSVINLSPSSIQLNSTKLAQLTIQ